MISRRLPLPHLVPLVICAVAILPSGAAAAERPLRVVTLTTVLTEIATEIGGDDVIVHGLVSATIDPHTFEPTPKDVRACVEADLVLASGLGLESYLDRLVTRAGTGGKLLIAASALKDPVRLRADDDHDHHHDAHDDHDHGDEIDPHWWQSPEAVCEVSTLVGASMAAARPAAAARIQERLLAWLERMEVLKAWAAQRATAVPPERRRLVTSHDAFGWLARDLGFELHPIKGFSPDAEPSGRHMAALIDLIRLHRVPAVFAESLENPRLLGTLTAETNARIGGALFADGLGPDGSGGETYEKMYRHNVETIVSALLER